MQWLKQAFAVDPEGPQEPSEAQRKVVDRVCREVVRRRMTTPALMFLEMNRPLNYLGSQAMQFFTPILAVVADTDAYTHFAQFLERRGSIDYLCRRIEALEAETDKPGQSGDKSAPDQQDTQEGTEHARE